MNSTVENNNQVERPISPETGLWGVKKVKIRVVSLELLCSVVIGILFFIALKSWKVDVIIIVVSILFSLLVDWAFIKSRVKQKERILEILLLILWLFVNLIEGACSYQGMHVLLNLPEHQWRWYMLLIIILGYLLVLAKISLIFSTASLIRMRKKFELEIASKS